MIEIGVFHNGASDLRATPTPDGAVVNDGSLEEVHQSYQRVLLSQIRQGILADRLGFDYWFMTEHHFMPEGPEFSPSPLLAETAIRRPDQAHSLGTDGEYPALVASHQSGGAGGDAGCD